MPRPARLRARARRLPLIAPVVLLVALVGACQPSPQPTAEWYGTVVLSKHHTYTWPGYTIRHDIELTASAMQGISSAFLHGSFQVVWTYAPPPQPACYLAEERWSAPTVGELAAIGVGYSSTGLPAVLDVDSDPIPYQVTYRYAGTDPYGGPCPATATAEHALDLYQNSGAFTDPTATTTWTGGTLAANTNTGGNLGDSVGWRWALARIPLTTAGRNYDLGDDDQLVLLRPDETRSLSSRMPYFTEIQGQPVSCDYSFAKRVSQVCTLYKAVLRADWAGNKFMLDYAAQSGKCGLYVIDGASWRPPKLRPATDASGTNIASVTPGRSQVIKTASGSITVTC